METNITSSNVNASLNHRVQNEWDQIAESAEFKRMTSRKKAFLVPATIFFLVYYFALPILAGYYKPIMSIKITESINFGYLFALSEFVMAWLLAHLYMKKSYKFDETASQVRRNMKRGL